MSENLKNFENLKEEKVSLVLNHLAIGLVDNKYTKLGKIVEKLLLIFGLSYIKIPLCYLTPNITRNLVTMHAFRN